VAATAFSAASGQYGPDYTVPSRMCSLQASLLFCVTLVGLIGAASALDQLVAGSTVVHVRVYAPPGFLRDKPEVFLRRGNQVTVTSNLHANGLQVDIYGNFNRPLIMTSCRRAAATICPRPSPSSVGAEAPRSAEPTAPAHCNVAVFPRSPLQLPDALTPR